MSKSSKRKQRKNGKPATGLRGNYADTCISCIRPTDTGYGVAGDVNWVVNVISRVAGFSLDEAYGTYRVFVADTDGIELADGEALDGLNKLIIRICAECAGKTQIHRTEPNPPPSLIIHGGEITSYVQPGYEDAVTPV